MNSPLLSSFSAVEDVLFNFAQSDGFGQVNQVDSARNQGLTAPELNTVVFLDAGVTDYQSLQAGVIPGVATVILSPNEDGIEQITAFLQQNPQITTIHLVSHGAPGCLYLGNCQLNLTNIYDYRQQLQNWANIHHILLYGCNVAAGDAGEEFVTKLHQLTGAKVMASAKRTGNEALGGDWELEVVYPKICPLGIQESPSLAFLPSAMAVYSDVLAFTERISVASDGTQGNSGSANSSISADGRYVVFDSTASNLVSGDTNNYPDIFVHDRVTGITSRISVAPDGTQGNGLSSHPSISADGRYVVFESYANNLVSGDTNNTSDIFVFDRVTGITSRVSVASDGTQGNNISVNSSISADGRYIAFDSNASNLVSGDTNNFRDIFVHDRVTGITSRISVATDGTQGNSFANFSSISADGRYIAFGSNASNLVSGDTNGDTDIFVHDRTTATTSCVSVASDGTQGNAFSCYPAISADGLYVAFESDASNLVNGDLNGARDVFVYDRTTGTTSLVSVASDGTQGNSYSDYKPSLSADGRYVAFGSTAGNLVSGDTNGTLDIFVRDRVTGITSRVSVATDGTQGNNSSIIPSISADGRYVAFESDASNLVSGDTNGSREIFVRNTSEPIPEFGFVQFGTSVDDYATSISTDSSGNSYVSGYTGGSLPGYTNQGIYDAFIAKYNADGTQAWVKQFGTSYYDEAWGISTDSSGNSYVTGDTTGSLPGNTNQGGEDAYIAVFDTNGNLISPPTILGPVIKIGDEFQVNTYTTSVQAFPMIAMDTDGDFVVTWQSDGQDGDGNGIYAQRYNRLGIPQGSEFRVNTFTPRGQTRPAIAMDGDGDFIVTWSSRDQGPTGHAADQFAQRYNSAGVPQGSEFQVNTSYINGDQGDGAVALDADGDFVITWSSYGVQDGSGDGVYAKRYNSAGVVQGSEFQVNTFTTNNQNHTAIAMDADGDFVITWMSDGQDGSGLGIYAQRYNSTGVAQGSEFRVNSVTANNQSYPAIAMDSEGNFAIAWLSELVPGSSYGIFAQRYNSSGVALGQQFQVNTTAIGPQVLLSEPAISMADNGNFVISWHNLGQDGSAEGVYAQYYNQNGTPAGSEFQVNTFTTDGQLLPTLAMDGVGNFTAAWVSNNQDGELGGIYAQQFTPFSPSNITLAVSPESVTEDGTANLVYTFTRTGSPTDALTVNFNVAGSATFNTDYTQTGAASFTGTAGTITFAPGSATATLTIDPTADTTHETDETVALTLATGTGYAIGTSTTVTGTITNDDDTNLLWIRQLGTPNEDGPWGGGIATDGNENLYVTGVTFGNLGGINAGPPDAFLVKYDKNGNLAWKKQLGSSNYEWYEQVATDSNNNVYLSGGTAGNLAGTNAGLEDLFLAKYDQNGHQIWVLQYGSYSWDSPLGMTIDSGNNIYLAGATGSNLGGPNAGDIDAYLIKYDENGNRLWVKQWGTVNFDHADDIALDSSGNLYISGRTNGNLGGTNAGSSDAFLAKYDLNGHQIWIEQLGSSGDDTGPEGVEVITDSAGNVYIASSTNGNLGGTNAGGKDAWVAKYDSSGNQLWLKQFGTAADDIATDVKTDAFGNLYLTGQTAGSLGGTNAGGTDAWFAKYDENGNLLWIQQTGTSADDSATGIAPITAGNFYLTGGTEGSLGGPNAGDFDIWVAKYSQPSNLIPTLGNSTYYLTTATTWTDAEAQAVAMGGHLVTVNDATENLFLVNTFGTESLWIGYTDAAVEGQWEWVSGETSTYTNWAPGQPDNYLGSQDYARYTNYQSLGNWDDLDNNQNLRGIVEIKNTTPTVTLAVSPESVSEDGTTNLVYTFTRSGVTTNALTVNYTVEGTATNGTDYTSIPTSVTFAAGSSTATVTVDPTADTIVESNETVILTLASGTGYTIGTTNAVTGTITNDDTSVTLAVSPASVTEDGTTNLVYTFTRSGVTTNSLTVNYTLGGTATLNTDYTRTGTTNTVTFAAGSSTATVTVNPTADTIVESNETVILTLASGTGYTIGTPNAATGTINNDDSTVTSQLSINNITVVEGKDNNAILTVTVNNPNPQPISVNYAIAPVNATANVDYTSKTGTITIAANTSTATITIPILNDNLNEANETFAINLSNPINATLTNNKGIVTISDTLTANVTTTLPANVENLTLTGTTNINGTGNAANNIITGNSGNNILNGATGIDTLIGGLGNDTYQVDTTTDTITENVNQGTDTVQSSVTYTLGNNLENLTLTGTANINGTGNTLNNIITGNSGNNILNGATGIDTLIGGLGNDTYQVDTTTDTITENANQGTDTVQSSVTYTLGNNLENLTLTGTTAINGTGNAANNILTGNSGNNILNGSDGNDTLIGGTGNDTITGGAGSDRFTFNNRNEGIDTITDFLSSQGDKITVSAGGFGGGLAAGVAITAAQFLLGTTALNASNRFIYNTITGGLFFDGDGTGTLAAIQIATLSSKPTLTASDILVLV
ncbi:MAG: DUF4347 domain-containing protein [Microcystis sp. LE19-338.1B]|nr:DUF4347 domain-containing protein [Microcystis sp. LE19-338.1B]